MTAIAFASSADQQSATATVVVNKPSTGTATDVFVAHWSVAGNVADGNMTLPSGWTQVGYISPTGGPTVKLAYKVAIAGGEPSNYTFTLSGAANHSCNITRWSNVDTTHVADAFVSITTNSATSGTTLTASDIVPESDNALLIAAFANSVSTDAITIPAGFSTAVAHTTLVRNTVAYMLQTTAGHSNDLTATQAATAGWTAILWAMRPLDLGTVITITPGLPTVTSKLELGVSYVTNGDYDTGTFRTNFLAQAQGVYARSQTFVGGFGMNDPIYSWDGTGAVPSTPNEIRSGVNVFNTAGFTYYLGVSTALGIPLDWLIWRLPWQFTVNPNTGVNSVQADYYGSENRRIRSDQMANYQIYLRAVGKYLMQHGARNFTIGSELKGFQQDFTNNLVRTWDYNAYYTFYVASEAALSLAATDASLTRNDIAVGGAYAVVSNRGATSSDAVTFNTLITNTAPTQTIRYSDDATPSTWTMNNPAWGYPNKEGLQAQAEFFKLCANNGTRVDFFATDFGMANEDHIIKSTDDFAIAEGMTRDHARWSKRMLQDVAGGTFAALVLKITEYYIKAEGTIAQTTNTLLAGGGAIPGPFLPTNQLRAYFAAIKAIGLAVCVEEGITTPYWWSPFEDANARSAPQITGGSTTDKQSWYGESFIHKGATTDGETGFTSEGDITAVGLMNKMFNTDFAAGTLIRAVTVSDSTKVYALPNLTKCVVINKTAGRKSVSVNGHTVTLAPYDTQEVIYANAYSLSLTPGSYTLTGTAATLKYGRRLPAAVGSYALTGTAVTLTVQRKLTATAGAYTLTGTSTTLRITRRLVAQPGSYTLTGNNVALIHQPPYTLVAQPGSYALTGTNTSLLATRKLIVTPGSYTYTGVSATLTVQRKLSAAVGTYTLTGASVTLRVTRRLTADAGSYTLTGTDANLHVGHVLAASVGSYTLTGTVARLLHGYRLAADVGSYVLTGTDTALKVTRRLSMSPGSYTLTGTSANLTYTPLGHFLLLAQPGNYTYTGQAVTLTVQRKLTAQPGSYNVTGNDVGLFVARLILAATGSYTLTGQDAQFTYSSAPDRIVPSERINTIASENRVLAIEHENRILVIESESRTLAIPSENRTFVIEHESRVFAVSE